MQKILLLSLLLAVLSGCRQEPAPAPTAPATAPPLSRSELNAVVENHLRQTNSVYDWNAAPAEVVWSALELSDHEAVLGYRPAGAADVPSRIHALDLRDGEWRRTRDELVSDLLAVTARATGKAITEEELFVAPEDGVLPILEVRILHPDVLTAFRERPEVRYLEPSNYTAEEIQLRSDSGCSEAPAADLDPEDYVTVAPGAKVGVELRAHGHPRGLVAQPGRQHRYLHHRSPVLTPNSRASTATSAAGGTWTGAASTNRASGAAVPTAPTTAAATAPRWPDSPRHRSLPPAAPWG